MKIELKELLNYVKNIYAVYKTDKDVNILFMNKEKFENNPKLYKPLIELQYDYTVYLKNLNNEIMFATDNTGRTVIGITEDIFINYDIIREVFL
jgi:ADP-heptose:LPS heptosyltransferase